MGLVIKILFYFKNKKVIKKSTLSIDFVTIDYT